MQFTIRDIFWLTLFVSVATYAMVSNYDLSRRLKQLENRLHAAEWSIDDAWIRLKPNTARDK